MQINTFFDAYEGLWVEYRSITNPDTRDQCTDLFLVYNREVVGAPPVYGNADDYFDISSEAFYDRIVNSPTAVPKKGDVIIWGINYGPYGHIAVCTDIADTKGFTSFDQNDPLKSPCHFQPHSYSGVLGWLRPKSLPDETPTDPNKVRVDLGEYGVMEVQAIKSILADLKRDIKNEQDKMSGFVQKWIAEWHLPVTSSLVDIEVEMSKLLTLEDRVQEYRDSIEGCVGAFPSDSALLEAHKAIQHQIEDLTDQIAALQQKLSGIKVPDGYKFLKSWKLFSLMWMLYRRG
jgi:surface antigen